MNEQLGKAKAYVIATPINFVSGGPELCHQLCHKLRKLGKNAYIYYYDKDITPSLRPCPEPYRKYDTERITDLSLLKREDTVLILPEAVVNFVEAFPNCVKCIWWLSVNNYLLASQDAINPEHLPGFDIEDMDGSAANFDLVSVMQANPDISWFPIQNMTPKDVGNLLRLVKVYIDLGGHPGKDRIPREAAISGCCIITNKKGSANYPEDVPIPEQYKFDNPQNSANEIGDLIRNIFENYAEHRRNYEEYCDMISQEEKLFEEDIKHIFVE